MFKKPLDLARLQMWIGAACLLLCLAANAWTLLYRRSEFLTSLGFTMLVAMVQLFGAGKRNA